jgi:DNA/RNA-binding domain of Phe-tRNA-synthetase-like protein
LTSSLRPGEPGRVTTHLATASGRATLDGIAVETDAPGVVLGLVVARGVTVAPAGPALDAALEAAVAAAVARADAEPVTRAVRDLLRHGRYKPTGRGKPASEYLLGAAQQGRFPRINNLVDVNNLVSVATLLPISLIDLDRAATAAFAVRRGRAGEAYVFNTAGQAIELEDLLLVARLPADEPCANPVKDALATKLDDRARAVLAVVYAPAALGALLAEATARMAALLEAHGGAERVCAAVLTR